MSKFTCNYKKAMEAFANELSGPSKTNPQASETKPGGACNGLSLVNYLKSIGANFSFGARASLAVSHGIVEASAHYKGTSAQNEALLLALKRASRA